MRKKLIALLCMLTLIVTSVMPAYATEAVETDSFCTETASEYVTGETVALEDEIYVNPIYADQIEVSDLAKELEEIQQYSISLMADTDYVTTEADAAAIIRDGMVNRQETIQVYYETNAALETDNLNELVKLALEETDSPKEGDYLSFQYGGYSVKASASISDGVYFYTITYTLSYYTTAAQEAAVDVKIADVLEQLGITTDGVVSTSMSDYEKISAIYDYICQHVTYDNEHLSDTSYKLQFTAYAALINGTSVCQGYANLFYRLAKEAGLNVRIVTGTGNGGGHAWNIVELNKLYYYADATWDASYYKTMNTYGYFLKGTGDFDPDTTNVHVIDESYKTEVFLSVYPIAKSAYTASVGGDTGESESTEEGENTEDSVEKEEHVHVFDTGTVTIYPTCTTTGEKIYACSGCDETYTEVLPANEHTEATDAAKAATCTTTGLTAGSHCSVCGEIITVQEVVAMKAHSYSANWTVDKTATTSAAGSKSHHCTVCGAKGSVTAIPKIKSVTLSAAAFTYNGKIQKPSVTVKDNNGATISSSYYTVKYADGCKNVGTYKVTVTFKGNYSGTATQNFTIKAQSLSASKVTLSKTSYTYDGKAKTPSVTVKNAAGTKLTKDTDYTVTYASGRKKPGTYKVTIKGKGNYTGTITKTFTVKVKNTSIKSLTAGSKKFTAKWSKQSSKYISGYQIRYSVKSDMSNAKKTSRISRTTTSKKISGLKAKKKYYVQIRTYKKIGSKYYYSSWSKVKKIKTK